MFGTNPVRKQELETDGTLATQSIFYTIQGEGPFAGLPAVFIRLAGCNLRCHYCDTDFESSIHQRFDLARILAEVREGIEGKIPPRLIVLTGGEPFRQDIRPLVAALITHGYHVQIETAGTLWLPGLEYFLRSKHEDVTFPGLSIVVSPKTGKVRPEIELFAIAWKYIVKAGEEDPEDGLPNSSTQIQNYPQKLARPPEGFPREKIFVQPCYEYHQTGFQAPNLVFNRLNTTAAAEICMKHGYRLSLQQHKIVGLE